MIRPILVVALVLLAGCSVVEAPTSTGPGTPTRATPEPGYVVSTSVVDTPPAGATVTDYNASKLRGDDSVKRIVEETYEEGGLFRNVGTQEVETLRSELADVPRHDGGGFGYYVEYRGAVVKLQILVEE